MRDGWHEEERIQFGSKVLRNGVEFNTVQVQDQTCQLQKVTCHQHAETWQTWI